ncbi:MAG: DUF4417 domain-containing protein [Lachnospiraceae bacterium]|nr:DUF4417 domain-containing protein [Lachnospiraceae bacterium]
MQIQSIMDIISITDFLYQYLSDKDIDINDDGFPIFRPEMFLTEWPDLVIPYSQRKNGRVVDKEKTVICFFDKDHRLYPRVSKVLDDIAEYKQYMGVIGLDITITNDMDEEWQRMIFLLNQLFLAVLAVNGIKIIINSRTGGLDPTELFKSIPSGIMVASGFLGCDKITSESDLTYVKKIMALLPGKLIIYGKHDRITEKQLDTVGIDYRVYKDFHRLCKEVHHG